MCEYQRTFSGVIRKIKKLKKKKQAKHPICEQQKLVGDICFNWTAAKLERKKVALC